MPRKKLDPTVVTPQEEPTPAPTVSKEQLAKPKRSPRKPKEEPAAALLVEPPIVEVALVKKSRGSKKVAEPVPVEQPVLVEVVAEPKKKPAAKKKEAAPAVKASRAKKAVAPDWPEIVDPDGLLLLSFRPRSTKPEAALRVERQPEPVAAEPVAVAIVETVVSETEVHEEHGDGDLTIIAWRTAKAQPDAAPRERSVDTHAVEPSEQPTDRQPRRGGRSRKEPKPQPVAEAAVEVVQPEPVPVAPEVAKKLSIHVPEDAPQVVMRNGIPTLVSNRKVLPPIIFFGNPGDERKAETVFDELRMAAEAGVHIHSFLIQLVVDRDTVDNSAGFAGYLLGRAVDIDPEAHILFRLEFQAPKSWESRYPKAVYRDARGEIAEPSVCDDEYWGVAQECLELFIKKIRLLDKASHILGLQLERGEWFLSEGHGFDTSKAATQQFRDWARRRYINDEVTLRASWFDGQISFDTIQVPDFNPEGQDGERFIRSSRKQRRYVDYHLFLSDATCHRVTELAYQAKAAGEGRLLVGVSYGYTFEWTHPASGHLALGKLLRTDEIDFIAGPPSYRNRQPNGSAPFPCPIDSFALNGKLYISEEDFKTSLSRGHEPDDFNPALKTPQALESVHWRGAGVALAHGSGVEWMDLWGNGWLRTHSVWERAARVRQALINRMDSPLGDPDVAVFIDERALAYLVDSNAFDLLVQNVRESVLRAGVSAAFYLLSDLAHREKFPESRLYLFLNAWDIRPELRAAIKSRLQRDNKVLFWLYSAGLFDAGRDSLERAREVTGIALKPQPFYSKAGTTILNRHPLSEAFPDKSLIGGMKLEPSYFAIPEDGLVLGEYTQTGLPSFVVKEFKEDPNACWTSVFLGEPVVNPALIRALAQMAGAHVWNFQEDVVHVRGPFCTVHCSGTGPRTITLPNKACAYNLLTGDWSAMDSTSLKFIAIDGSTYVFLVGSKSEIEHFLNTNPDELLKMENIPPRDQNVRLDTANFDVPIMKLDEWIEGGDQDEVADEWFLRPQAMLDETETETGQAEESPEQVGRRRRRRRRGGRGGQDDRVGSEQVVTAGADSGGEDAFSMNVVFRKRE